MARAGIDVGGTFTDAVLVDRDGEMSVAKVRSTPADPSAGFLDGLRELSARSGVALSALSVLAHGTTVATNALVQRRLARCGLITNDGFRDVLEIGTQMRERLYDLWTPQPEPVVPRERCFGVRGRIGPEGQELEPLDEDDVRAAAAGLRAYDVEAVAIVLLFSFVNARHEERVAELLAEELPGVALSLSSQVSPEYREYTRASTTAVNAALLPVVGAYVRRLATAIESLGIRAPLHLMQSNGGVATAEQAGRLPLALAASGPAAGVIAGARLGQLAGEQRVLTFDMGGTTADVALVVDGLPTLRYSGRAAGGPINLPQIDVLSVGAGGGSIARVDPFGSLTVGPESAGAVPGPAAYGTGGTDATVTDAHVVLGTLPRTHALADGVTLDAERARRAVEEAVARPLGLAPEEAAAAVLRVANANMANALRLVSIARGHDPRTFALVALGGAGPMHACAIAGELGIPRVVVPRYPGVAAALGLLLTDVRHDLRRSFIRLTSDVDPATLDGELGRLERGARALLGDVSGEIAFELDMRYRGQAYNLTVPLAPRPATAGTIAAAEQAFAELHRTLYDYTPSSSETEIVTVRARAITPVGKLVWRAPGRRALRTDERRSVWENGVRAEYRVVMRDALGEGDALEPRTIVEQEDATTLVPPGWSGRVAAAGAILLEAQR